MRFDELFKIDFTDKTEKKGSLTYLSWAWAWAEFKKVYPEATYKVNPFDGTFCSGNEKIGYMVQTWVSVGDLTYEMWLPVMDARNNTILQPKMTEINKAIMRCLTKNLAMFGLGLYIYAGEDLPENQPKATAKKIKPITQKELKEVWKVNDVQKFIAHCELKFKLPISKWQEEHEWVREYLRQRAKEAKESEGA